jgi:hypothetical protein
MYLNCFGFSLFQLIMTILYRPYKEQYRVVSSRQFNGGSSKKRREASALPDEDLVEEKPEPVGGLALNPIAHNYRVVADASVYDLGVALSPIIRRASSDNTHQSTYNFLLELVFFYVHGQPVDSESISATQMTEIIQCVIQDHVPVKQVIHAVFLGVNRQPSVNCHRFQTLLMSIVTATSVLSIETIQSVIRSVLGAIESLSIKKRSDKERFLRGFSTQAVRYYSKTRAIVVPAVVESIIQTTMGFMDKSVFDVSSMQHLCGLIKLFLGKPDVMDAYTQAVFTALDQIPHADPETQAELKSAWQAYYGYHIRKNLKLSQRVRLESVIVKQQYAERWCQCIQVLSQTESLTRFTPAWLKAFQKDLDD